jgi:hypothetical protein
VLNAYIGADEKYFVSPLPVHLERPMVSERIIKELSTVPDHRKMSRLTKLASFYNTRNASESFRKLLEPSEGTTLDMRVALYAIQAIGWIGNETDQQFAVQTLAKLMNRTRPDKTARREVLATFKSWGPRLNLDQLIAWLNYEHTNLKSSLQAAHQQKNEPEAEDIEDELDSLEYFVKREITIAQQENQIRSAVDAMVPDDRYKPLTRLYLEDSDGSSPEISYWAALSLVRLSKTEPQLRPRIAQAFVELSREFLEPSVAQVPDDEEPEKEDEEPEEEEPIALEADEMEEEEGPPPPVEKYAEEDPQMEADINRAICLRAARFFGAKLSKADVEWLSSQDDPGTALLVLRPNWEYK